MLGLGPATSLLGRALERWGCADAEELLHALTRIGGPEKSEAGRFADAVLDEAEAGDRVARDDRPDGRAAGWATTRASARRAPGSSARRSRSCSAAASSGIRRRSSRRVLESRVPDGQPVYPDVEPVAGAVLLAADRVGARPDLAHLRSRPPARGDRG